jgi:predicted PurR-regulated permease PerM
MQFAQWLGLISLLLMVLTLWRIRQLLLLLFAAVVVANGLNHLAAYFQRRGLKRGLAIVLAVGCFLGSLSLFIWRIIPPFLQEFQQLLTLVPQGINELNTWLGMMLAQVDPDLVALLPTAQQLNQQFQPLLTQIAGRGVNLFYGTLGLPLSFLLLLVLSLMLLADPQAYRRGFIRLFPAFYRQRLDYILTCCEARLEEWLVTMLLSLVSVSVLTFLGLLILGIPLPLALALLAGLLSIIPNIGPLLSVVPPMAIALLEAPGKALAVLVVYVAIQQLESHYIVPRLLGKPLALLRGLLLLAQVFFASVFGLLGLVLAAPLTVIVQVLFKEILVKDILDHWQGQSFEETDPSVGPNNDCPTYGDELP